MRYKNISDCHSHSNCSFDWHPQHARYVQNAIEMGLVYYAVTDHCECNQYMNVPHIPADGITMSYVSPMRSCCKIRNVSRI